MTTTDNTWRMRAKVDSGAAFICDILVQKVRIPVIKHLGALKADDILRDTYRRSEGSPLTLFTVTHAQGQRTLQRRGTEESGGPSRG